MGQGEVWIKHNVEEVGAFEQFLPALYYRETGGGPDLVGARCVSVRGPSA